MADTEHFQNFSCVHGHFTAEVHFDRFSRQFAAAQQWLAEQVLADCKPFMPMETGSLIQRSYVDDRTDQKQAGRLQSGSGPDGE